MTPSDRAGWLLFIFAGASLLAILLFTKPAGAESLCADLSGDEAVTGADLNTVAQAIGTSEEWPDLSLDGAVTGADLNLVSQVIGRECWLHGGPDESGVSSDGGENNRIIGSGSVPAMNSLSPPSPDAALMMTGCRFLTYGFFGSQPANGEILIDDWGGRSYCFHTAGLYISSCIFGFDALYPPNWELVAVSDSVEIGGTWCAAHGYPAWLPCGRLILGKLHHQTRRDGFTVHGPHTHSEAEFGSMGFSVC